MDTKLEYQKGLYEPNWKSLAGNYECPEWFRDAKFGIWACFGVQSVPEENGSWYARHLYKPYSPDSEWETFAGQKDYNFHVKTYGHPSEFGMKDICNVFTAAKWDPERLIKLYKKAGAKYFVAMATFHDNFDNWDSTHQPWNSVNVGPRKDLIKGWADAARKNDLPFGVSVHAARAWWWMTAAFGSDRDGPLKGVPYDGHMTKADGKGKWWEGLDPQDLYTRPHPQDEGPDQAYIDKFYLRTLDLIDKYRPDLLYYDDHAAPLEDAGLKLHAHYYNSSLKWNDGKMEVVINTKGNDEQGRKALVDDVERGAKDGLEPQPWQTDTCIGIWFYNKDQPYKSPSKVITTLIDVVSKNGNLLLSIPMRGDGTIDEREEAILEEVGEWMDIHGEGIYGTRPWKVFGEGPAMAPSGMFQEDKVHYTHEDIRFTQKGDTLYVFCMVAPEGETRVKSLGSDSPHATGPIKCIELLGSKESIKWSQEKDALIITKPSKLPTKSSVCFRVKFKK